MRGESAGAEGRRRRRRRRGGSGGRGPEEAPDQRQRQPHAEAQDASPVAVAHAHENEGSGEIPTPDVVESGRDLAEKLFQAMGFEARVTAQAAGDTVEVRAEIPQNGDLVTGEKGEVRQAIQHILNRMLNRGGVSRHHLQLEINDFWAARERELQELAHRLADEVAADGNEKLTEYLNAQERRVIHVTLRDDTRVRTYGLGDGLIKKVAISPAAEARMEKTEG
jgi:predicted RNA-binding protein Jag